MLIIALVAASLLIPHSIRLYEEHTAQLPQSRFHLSLCALLAHPHGVPFYATPADVGAETCDLSGVHLAYQGWCAAGMLDKTGPHFSQSLMPQVTIVDYADGIVIYVNNWMKSHSIPDAADEAAAVQFLQHLPATFDVRGGDLPLFPVEWEGRVPLRKHP